MMSLVLLPFAAKADSTISNSVSQSADQAISASTGPTTATGPTDPTGPQVQTGPTDPTGPSTAPGPNSLSNSQTGADSTNTNSVDESNSAAIASNNSSQTQNSANINMNSGQNDLTKNTAVGSVTTGDNAASVNIIDIGNAQFSPESSIGASSISQSIFPNGAAIPASGPISRINIPSSLTNQATGSGSVNLNQIDKNNLFSFVNNDNSTANNNITILANTGRNQINQNTDVNNVSTGNIKVGANIIDLSNFINPNGILDLNVWSFLNGLTGDLIIPTNSATGANSSNQNNVNGGTNTNIVSNNNSSQNNQFNIKTNTGGNDINQNSEIGNISTGQSETTQNQLVIDSNNTDTFYLVNVFGKFLGSLVGLGSNVIVNQIGDGSADNSAALANSQTGANSVNSNSVQAQNNINLENNNNSTKNNSITVDANTGQNTVDRNTKIGNLTTGSINVITNALKIISNLSQGAQKTKISIINIFGDLKGDIVSDIEASKRAAQKPQTPNSVPNIAVISQNTNVSNAVTTVNNSSKKIGLIKQSSSSQGNSSAETKTTLSSSDINISSLLPHANFATYYGNTNNSTPLASTSQPISAKDFSMPIVIGMLAMLFDIAAFLLKKK